MTSTQPLPTPKDQALKTLAAWMAPQLGPVGVLESDWKNWLRTLFPTWVSNQTGDFVEFGAHHIQHWEWVWGIEVGVKPPPLVEIWPRGGAKSTTAELTIAALAARRKRKYCLYISGTQEQADDHVSNTGNLLETPAFAKHYPSVASRALNRYGSPKGWRRNRLRTASGFTVDAIGLDTAARGVKLEEARPDFLILDDIDEETDNLAATDKKVLELARKLLPAGASDSAVLCIQNLVIPDGIFSRLAQVEGSNEIDILQNRVLLGPYPAIYNAQVTRQNNKYFLIGGTPLWEGQGLAKCQEQIEEWGYTSWKVEAQQEVTLPPGGLFSSIDFESIHVLPEQVPELVTTVVWVDPAVTSTDRSDSHGIQADSLGVDELIYRQRSWEGKSTPVASLERAITWCLELKGAHVGVETDQGGELWEIAYNEVWNRMVHDFTVHAILGLPTTWQEAGIDPASPNFSSLIAAFNSYDLAEVHRPPFHWEKAGAGYGPKTHRASRMLVDYEHGLFRHVLGTHDVLERALGRFPLRKPYDLTDAAFWSWNDLKASGMVGVGGASDPPQIFTLPTPVTHKSPLGTIGVAGRTGRIWGGHSRYTRTLWRTTQVRPVGEDDDN